MALKAAKKVQKTPDELEKISAELDAEEIRRPDPNTPLTDEDGVVRGVPLLAGYVDPETGICHQTFDYREMNGADEEAINKADVRANGAKLVNVLCERCVVAIGTLQKKDHRADWGKIIRSMLGGDLDYMVFKIRELSKGHEVKFTHKCPHCGQQLTTIMDTDEFKIRPFLGEREIAFTLNKGYKDVKGNLHREGVFHLATGFDREVTVPIIKKNPSTAMTMLMTRCVVFSDGTTPLQSNIKDMVLRDRKVIEEIIRENTFGVDTSIEGLTCESCGQDISGELGQSDFF